MTKVTCIEDLRVLAKRRVPRMFYDYADSGSWSEATYRRNNKDLQALQLRQRVAVNIEHRSIAATILEETVAMPVVLAPTGLAGMQHADGEILAAQAAATFGVPFCLSTMSICSIEDVAAATRKPFWFQLYVMRDRRFVEQLIERAAAASCSALVLTLDLQIIGQRHKDIRNGLSTPPRITPANVLDMALRPSWCWRMMRTSRRRFGNIVGHVEGVADMQSLSAWTAQQFDPSLTWEDIAWVRKLWSGKLVLKGIMDVDDARNAAAIGANAIVVSNHGGRQLDGAPSSISALPAIVAAVGSSVEVLFDGGVMSGQDVFKSLASGARAAMIGRAYLYGLGAGGRAGVSRALEIIARELDLTMGFCGLTDVRRVGSDVLVAPSETRTGPAGPLSSVKP